MDESVLAAEGNHEPAEITVVLESLEAETGLAEERNLHRLTGLKFAVVISVLIWGAIVCGVYAALHLGL